MADPVYPNVPLTPGVPPVLRRTGATEDSEPMALPGKSDEIDRLSAEQWGVYSQGGAKVLDPDNVASFELNREYRIADYPIEAGGFQSYNKVATPFDIRLSVSKGGKLADRQAFEQKVDALMPTLDLYNVTTPERTYLNVTFERVGQTRTSDRGAGMLTMELGLREVRQGVTTRFSDSKTPAGTDAVNGGAVQPQPTNEPGTDVG